MAVRASKAVRSLSLALLGLVAAASAASAADQKHVFRLIAGEPRFMDPNLATDYSIYINSQLFEPLYRLRPDGTMDLLQARSVSPSADGKTWTIKLDPTYKWSNGKPVIAADWEYSWKRALDPKLASEVAPFLYDVMNAEGYNKGKITDAGKVGVKAVDDTTLEVTTSVPSPSFRAVMGLPYLTPVPKEVVEKAGAKWIEPGNILSNGPYRLVSWQHDQSIVMERNPSYGGKPPAIDRVEIQIASGDLCTSQLRAYEAGEVDFATCIPTQDIARVKSGPLSKEFSPSPASASVWVQFDNSRAPWNDKRVRQAMAMVIDRQAIVNVVSEGTAKPSNVLVPADIPGNNPADALTGSVEKAKQLLAQAGFPDGKGLPQLTLTASANRGQPLIAQLLQQMWQEKLGIRTTINVLEENAYRAWIAARKKEPYDLVVEQWYSDYADPKDWYDDVFVQDARNMHFVNQKFDELVKQGNAETDQAKRVQIFQAANKILEEEQPAIALYFPTDLWLIKPDVAGLTHEGVLDLYHIGDARFQ